MLAHKMHRIVNGDPFFFEHWHDMEGYTKLITDNWDAIVSDGQIAATIGDTLSQPTFYRELLDKINEHFGTKVDAGIDGSGHVVLRVARPEAPAERLEDAGDRSAAPAPATVPPAPSDAPRAPKVGEKVRVRGWPRDLVVREDRGGGWWRVGQPGSESFMDVQAADIGYPSERIADAGGPVVLSEEDEVPMPSMVRREPINATHAEYESFKNQEIVAGTMKGRIWAELYYSRTNDAGRWPMIPDYHEEYGK